MLDRILVDLSTWFLLSIVIGLLVGRAISTLQKANTLRFAPPLETYCETAALSLLQKEHMLVLSQPQMQEVG
jgi:hypothetical protein